MSFRSLLEINRPDAYNCQAFGLDIVLPEPYLVPLSVHLAFARAFADGVSVQAEIDELYNQLIRSVWGDNYNYRRDAVELKINNTSQLLNILCDSYDEARPITFFVSDNSISHAVSVAPVEGDDKSMAFLVSNMSPVISTDFGENVMILSDKELNDLLFPRLINSEWGNAILWPSLGQD